jgi:hypothetical protein
MWVVAARSRVSELVVRATRSSADPLGRMLAKVDELAADRDRMVGE